MPGLRQRRRDTLAFTVVVSVLVVLGGAGMLLVLALSGAPRTMVTATVLATVPVVPLVGCYLWLDRYEPEPRPLLAAGLWWGGFEATPQKKNNPAERVFGPKNWEWVFGDQEQLCG
jgi:hypothetical protein